MQSRSSGRILRGLWWRSLGQVLVHLLPEQPLSLLVRLLMRLLMRMLVQFIVLLLVMLKGVEVVR